MHACPLQVLRTLQKCMHMQQHLRSQSALQMLAETEERTWMAVRAPRGTLRSAPSPSLPVALLTDVRDIHLEYPVVHSADDYLTCT